MEWKKCLKTQRQIIEILKVLELNYINPSRIFCYKTNGSKSRAIARIWSFPKIFQEALEIKPAYVIEMISERYDKLSEDKKTKVLIHELLHIPKNFSGSLLPHKYGKTKIEKEVERLYKKCKNYEF